MSETDGRATPPGLPGCNPALVLVETALAAWLGFAHAVFGRGLEGAPALQAAAVLGLAGAVASAVAGGSNSGWKRGLTGLAIFPILAGFIALVRTPAYAWSTVAWFMAVAGIAGLFLRRPDGLLHDGAMRERLTEAGRWVLLLAAGTLLMLPFYTHRPIGSGDAHWYTLMLSDFVLQVRSGVFPVWVGQTEYAFNGAVNPLRIAPWFQHVGALLDVVTMQSLEFISLKNALLCLNFLVLGGTVYACLRRLLPARPGAAGLLAVLLLASPAMLAPLYTGDQYMTFFALPLACLAVYGLGRVLEADRSTAYAPLCAGLAGLWLAHTPLAVWLSLLSAFIVGPRLLFLRSPDWWRRLGLAGAAFAALGTYPIVSVLHLENTVPLSAAATGGVAAEQVARLFPGALLPLSAKLAESSDYQPGYALLLVAVLSILALLRHRPPAALGLAAAIGLLGLLLLPVPAWADLVWRHLPDWLLKINGAWPHQRLLPLASIIIVYLGAQLLRDWRLPGARVPRALPATLALIALAWSGAQASGFIRSGWSNTGPGPKPALGFQTNNLSLTRYAFSSFGTTPGYYSHGYINPLLEHRLLRADGSVLAANAPAAAREPAGTRVAAGVFTAVNDNNTAHYNLEPRVWLPGGKQMLLKFTPLNPVDHGWLQVVGEDVFREYILPDSGTAAVRHEARSFGTLPGLSPYVPLLTLHLPGETPRLTVILPDIGVRPPFAFADFELWQFDPSQLPVAVRSWAPYRLHVRAPEPALVESPRVWLPGYQARIAGRRVPVQRSADGLAMFPVPAGESDLLISYSPPLPVTLSYWLTVVAWGVATLAAVRHGWLVHPISGPRPADLQRVATTTIRP